MRLGQSKERIGRADGWRGLRLFELPRCAARSRSRARVRGHAGRQVDAIDIYSTDAKLEKYGLTVLEDDRKYLQRYDAVLRNARICRSVAEDLGRARQA